MIKNQKDKKEVQILVQSHQNSNHSSNENSNDQRPHANIVPIILQNGTESRLDSSSILS
jgi:hypothetical protein